GANLLIKPEDIRANSENYTNIPHYQRYNQAMKFLKETEFEEYNCKIVKNENNEIEIVTKNAFGGEIRKSDEELLEELDLEYEPETIEFSEAQFSEVLD
ncbi:16807_t:CDS:2, partial [Funneliformis geosporum]